LSFTYEFKSFKKRKVHLWMNVCMYVHWGGEKKTLIYFPPIGSLIKSKSNIRLLKSHVSNYFSDLIFQISHGIFCTRKNEKILFVGLFSVLLCWECQAIILWVLPCHSSKGELMMMHWHLGLSTWLIPQVPTRKSQQKKKKEKKQKLGKKTEVRKKTEEKFLL
jgi:hypothetical protein